MNVCSYHLQEAGATPVQEIAYSLATAIGVLDAVRESGQVAEDRFPAVVGVDLLLRQRRHPLRRGDLQDAGLHRAVGPHRPRALRRHRRQGRAGSATACRSTRLGLTEAQPENNVQRIVLEALGVTLSKKARARSLQLPAWNEALGLPRPWDQQWSLRIQQVLAYETDLLEYDDIFDGSHVVEAKTAELVEAAQAELDDVLALGGAFEAIDELKGRLVRSHTERMRRIESGELTVVGVNRFTETAPSPARRRGVDPARSTPRVQERADRRRRRRGGPTATPTR